MKILQYKCKLLSDVIITSEAATEGYNESLDYIPGSKFLGIVAGRLYDEKDPAKTLDLFHNGKVKFGDALPFIKNETLKKVPLSWYYAKGNGLSDTVYLHHNIKADSDIQLKQARTGYFSEKNGFYISLDQNFSLKSAQNPEKEGQRMGRCLDILVYKQELNGPLP